MENQTIPIEQITEAIAQADAALNSKGLVEYSVILQRYYELQEQHRKLAEACEIFSRKASVLLAPPKTMAPPERIKALGTGYTPPVRRPLWDNEFEADEDEDEDIVIFPKKDV